LALGLDGRGARPHTNPMIPPRPPWPLHEPHRLQSKILFPLENIIMHRWSQLFIPTLREAPADAEVASHKLLVRAGYIRQLGAGICSFLFLGSRTTQKIMGIVRQEMDKIGQEFYLPALNPREVW